MKCPSCGAWTDVVETRGRDNGYTNLRTRLCANGHRFQSFEVLGPIYRRDPPTVRQTVTAAGVRAIFWARDREIWRRCQSATHAKVAQDLGLQRQHVTKAVGRMRRHLAKVAKKV